MPETLNPSSYLLWPHPNNTGLGPQYPNLKLAQLLCHLQLVKPLGTFLWCGVATLQGWLPTKWKGGCEGHR